MMKVADEQWRPVVGVEGRYEVSDRGRVRSVDRIIRRQFGRGRYASKIIEQPMPGVMLRPGVASNGYLTVSLSGKTHCVHSIVLTAFSGPRPRGADACHLNGDRRDNRASNLRWDSRSANLRDRDAHGTKPEGSRCSYAKLSDEAVEEILSLRGKVPQSTLAKRFSVSPSAIQAVHDGRTWKHVGTAQ